jgi:hypothetical protein
MKQLLALTFILALVISCKNEKKETDGLEATADSIYKEVIDAHDVSMVGWMKIKANQKEITEILDSLAAVRATPVTKEYETKLNETRQHLQEAYDAMDKWMTDIDLDSAKENPEERIRYFTEEKMKIAKVNVLIVSSLKTADSLIKLRY